MYIKGHSDWQLVFYTGQFNVKSCDLNLKLKNQTFKFPIKMIFMAMKEWFNENEFSLLKNGFDFHILKKLYANINKE